MVFVSKEQVAISYSTEESYILEFIWVIPQEKMVFLKYVSLAEKLFSVPAKGGEQLDLSS